MFVLLQLTVCTEVLEIVAISMLMVTVTDKLLIDETEARFSPFPRGVPDLSIEPPSAVVLLLVGYVRAWLGCQGVFNQKVYDVHGCVIDFRAWVNSRFDSTRSRGDRSERRLDKPR